MRKHKVRNQIKQEKNEKKFFLKKIPLQKIIKPAENNHRHY